MIINNLSITLLITNIQKYKVTLDERETAALAALIIEKFNVSEWTEYVATFIDIKGYHSPKEDSL